ncbi:MAG TPA: hypothetical protein VEL07_03095 [Planctomycetota bacterium]|nr:hypothetical protein [Planctomycetota bacterium]
MRRPLIVLPILIAAVVGCSADPSPSRPDDRGIKPSAPFTINHESIPAADDPQRHAVTLTITSAAALPSALLAIAPGPGVAVVDPPPPTDLGALEAGVAKQVAVVVRVGDAGGTLTATISRPGSSVRQSHLVRLGAAAAPVVDAAPPGEAPRPVVTPDGERVIIHQGTPR